MVLGLRVDVMDDGFTLPRIDTECAIAFLPRKSIPICSCSHRELLPFISFMIFARGNTGGNPMNKWT